MKKLLITILLFPLLSHALELQLETGANWQHRNDVKITPDNGTLVAFDEFDSGPFFHYRVELKQSFGEKHGVRLIYAPYSISVTGSSPYNVNYNGEIYSANQDYTVDYKFNSYRLGYTYRLFGDDKQFMLIGLTGKIRDAEISFTQNTTTSNYDNFGFVPLFYYAFQLSLGESWSFYSDGDFAAAPQGRAFDLTFKLRKSLSSNSQFGIGIRGLEGGAENDKVYTFSFLTYAIVDYVVSF